MNMILCFDLETKNKLLNNGYTFLKEVDYEPQKGFLFYNDGIQTDFSKDNLLYTNELLF